MTLQKLTIDKINILNKRVVIRVDFNVPIKAQDNKMVVVNDFRIKEALNTINYCIKNGASKIVLMSHLGRPDGQFIKKYSLEPVFHNLKKHLSSTVGFITEPDFIKAAKLVPDDKNSIVLMENLRFNIGEEGTRSEMKDGKKMETKATSEESRDFETAIKSLGDVYVNDAFGTAHRAHGSMKGTHFPIKCAGFLLAKELNYFSKVLENPERPFLAILGGAKVKDKIQLIDNMLSLVDHLIICGGMAYTFLNVLKNMKIGKSLYDEEGAQVVEKIMKTAQENSVKIHFPVDFVIAKEISNLSETSIVSISQGIPDDFMGLDIGANSLGNFSSVIKESKTILWNGPAGVFEIESFAEGTKKILDMVVEATKCGSTSVVGGGDTATCCEKWNKSHLISHVSTGGGSSLELMQGLRLPGVENLDNA